MTDELSTEARLVRLENAFIAYIRMHERDHAQQSETPPILAYRQEVHDFLAEVAAERNNAPQF